MSKKITLICTDSIMVVRFRRLLVKALQEDGFSVSIIAFDNASQEEIKNWNVDFYYVDYNNRNTNPFKSISLMKQLKTLLDQIKPDIVFTFQMTPNTFGSMVANKCGVKNIFAMVEGAGEVFINSSSFKNKLVKAIACTLLKRAFSYCQNVFFLNNDDKNEFIDNKLLNENKCVVVPGIGVDTDKFNFEPITNTNTFIMVSRLLVAKGVYEYCKAARIVKRKHPEATFKLIGQEKTITKDDIKEYIDDMSIEYCGFVSNIIPYIKDCYVSVLPSYREGVPMVLMEACSMGRGIITTNSIGTKETIIDGYNGLVVKLKDEHDLAEKMIYALEHVDQFKEFGKNARKLVIERFDHKKINKTIIDVINKRG